MKTENNNINVMDQFEITESENPGMYAEAINWISEDENTVISVTDHNNAKAKEKALAIVTAVNNHYKLIEQQAKDKATIDKLIEDNGLMKIELDNTNIVLSACEIALENRNADNDILRDNHYKLIDALKDYVSYCEREPTRKRNNSFYNDFKQLIQQIEQ